MSKYVWILDAGHGGVINGEYVTSGKRSPIWDDGTQYFEGVGNRNIADKLTQKLRSSNIDVVNIIGKIQEDISLQERCNLANRIYRENKNAIFVSIHSNGFTKESANGFSIYTSKGETKSDKIATVFYEQMIKYFPDHKARKDFTDGDIDKEANFYVLKHTSCPAILIENFFMTNYKECKELQNPIFVDKIVTSHFSAIMKFENSEKIIL